jgi:hypothetical protein
VTAVTGGAARARALATAAARWAGTRVGAATYLEDVPAAVPPITLAALAVAVDGANDAREHRLGGDPSSIRIRAATLTLDLIRRGLPAPSLVLRDGTACQRTTNA